MKNIRDMVITIVGLGMEGGSFAIALQDTFHPKAIYGVDIHPETLAAAKALHVIEEGFLTPEIPFAASDLVIMATYPAIISDYIQKYQKYLKQNAIITDVAGTKTRLVTEISSFLREDLDYIAGHPMAGNEHRGFLFADKNIFQNANYIITPHTNNKEENLELIKTVALAIGCSKVIFTDPLIHDKKMAYASQLVHAISASITNSDSFDNDLTHFVGGSFRDITRVAKINADLWTQTFLENKEFLVEEMDCFIELITSLRNSINEDNESEIYAFLQKSFDKKTKSKY